MIIDKEITTLISPYGGKLVDLVVPAEEYAEFKAYAGSLPSIQISERAVCDLELLACGASLRSTVL
jgi:sulfate adenylyltransferase